MYIFDRTNLSLYSDKGQEQNAKNQDRVSQFNHSVHDADNLDMDAQRVTLWL